MSAVPESRVWTDVMKYRMPEELFAGMAYAHREPDIAEYRYAAIEKEGIQSVWLITFYERVTFIGIVSTAENGRNRQHDG